MKTAISLSLIFVVMLYSASLLSSMDIITNKQSLKRFESNIIATNSNLKEIIDHSQWDKLVKKHVTPDGLVNYKGFQKDEPQLDNYLKMLSENEPSNEWSVEELLAFYINLYNAGTVKLIIENYPIKSIKDINKPWTKARIQVGEKNLSLDGIENGILRKMDDSRIHFAINCASISCPKLMAEAFTAKKINEQLERATKEFINSDKNEISSSALQLSSLFKWYKNDFKINGRTDVIAFINQYSNIKINPSAKISYKDYDWDLNE